MKSVRAQLIVRIYFSQVKVMSTTYTKQQHYKGVGLGSVSLVDEGVGNIPYSGKLSRKKTFVNFAILCLFVKVFCMKFGGMASLARHKRAIRESFLRKNRIFHQFTKVFSLESFSLYGIYEKTMWLDIVLLCCIFT